MISAVFNVLVILSLILFTSPLLLLIWESIPDYIDRRRTHSYRPEPVPGAGGPSLNTEALPRDQVNPSRKREA